MSNAKLNIFIRVIKKRIEKGETLEQILDSYHRLLESEKQEIREVFQNDNKI